MGKTLVIQPLPGIGDMVWHLPHLKAIAESTQDGKISLVTKRRSAADQMLEGASWISEIGWLDRAQGKAKAPEAEGRLTVTIRRLGWDEPDGSAC